MWTDAALALRAFFRSPAFALRHGMGWLFLVPALLWVAFAVGLFALSTWMVGLVEPWLRGLVTPGGAPPMEELHGFWAYARAFFEGTGAVVLLVAVKIALFFLFALVNKYIVLIALSPLLAYASERAEEHLTGRVHPFSLVQLLRDSLRGALIALRNGVLELAINLLVWAATLFMPLAAPFSALLLFGVSAYFYGFSMFDYVLERRRLGVRESVRAVNAHGGMVLMNGALFALLAKVPLVGLMCAPLMAAIGASLAWMEREQGPPGIHR